MRFYRIMFWGMISGAFFLSIGINSLSAENAPEKQQISEEKEFKSISVQGRLILKPQNEREDLLILHSKDRKGYIISGDFKPALKELLLDLGEDNLVLVKGMLSKGFDLFSENKYTFTSTGKRVLDTTQSTRYYHLIVTQIIDSKKSKEKLLPLETDVAEEARIRLKPVQQQKIPQMTIRPIEGKIVSVNFKSPIKTIEVKTETESKVLFLTSQTKIAPKIVGKEEPLFLSFNSLREGQDVYAEYIEDELKPEALFITIIKE